MTVIPFLKVEDSEGSTVLINLLLVESISPYNLWKDKEGRYYCSDRTGRDLEYAPSISVRYSSGCGEIIHISLEDFLDKLAAFSLVVDPLTLDSWLSEIKG